MSAHSPHVEDSIPAYVLDILEPDEFVLVSEHLARCPFCRAEWRRYSNVVHHLALAAPEVDPPADLKDRLMARIRPEEPPRPSLRSRLTGWLRLPASPALTTAALAVMIALVFSNIWLWRQVNQLRQTPSIPMQSITLTSTEAAPEARGVIIISESGEYGALVVDHLPPLDPAHQYQLWLIEDGKRVSGAVFSVEDDGYAAISISSDMPLNQFSGFGITVEPSGGSPGPTGEKVLGGTF